MTPDVRTVGPEAPLRECMAAMVQGRFSGLPVVADGRVVGIVTEGDLIKRLRQQLPWTAYLVDMTGVAPLPQPTPEPVPDLLARLREQPVREVMTRHVLCVAPDAEIQEVARILVERRLKRLPVVEGGRLIGMITRGDLVRGMLQG